MLRVLRVQTVHSSNNNKNAGSECLCCVCGNREEHREVSAERVWIDFGTFQKSGCSCTRQRQWQYDKKRHAILRQWEPLHSVTTTRMLWVWERRAPKVSAERELQFDSNNNNSVVRLKEKNTINWFSGAAVVGIENRKRTRKDMLTGYGIHSNNKNANLIED